MLQANHILSSSYLTITGLIPEKLYVSICAFSRLNRVAGDARTGLCYSGSRVARHVLYLVYSRVKLLSVVVLLRDEFQRVTEYSEAGRPCLGAFSEELVAQPMVTLPASNLESPRPLLVFHHTVRSHSVSEGGPRGRMFVL